MTTTMLIRRLFNVFDYYGVLVCGVFTPDAASRGAARRYVRDVNELT